MRRIPEGLVFRREKPQSGGLGKRGDGGAHAIRSGVMPDSFHPPWKTST
jgi:hypothetical protein